MKKNKKFIENIFSLFLNQGFNHILSLITFPYLIRILGPSNYGIVAFATVFTQYFIIFAEYGLNLIATRDVTLNKNNLAKVSRLFSLITILKVYLIILSFILMLFIVFAVPSLRENYIVYLISFLMVIGNSIFPVWLFQGLEKMKYITIANVGSKVVTTLCIFIFVKSEADYFEAIFLQSLGYIIAMIFSLYYAFKMFGIRFTFYHDIPAMKQYLKEGGNVLISSFSQTVYGQGAVLITGFILGQTTAGYYSVVQRVTSIIVSLTHPFSQVLYPYICKLIYEDKEKYNEIKKIIPLITLLFGATIGLIMFFSAGFIDKILTGGYNPELVMLFKIYAFIIALNIVNVILNPFLLSMKKYKEMKKIYGFASIMFIAISIPATYSFYSTGMALSIFLIEGFILWKMFRATKDDPKNKSLDYE